MRAEAPRKLDEKGRCCGRKPLVYKRDGHTFCVKCDRAFDLVTGEQIDNWAWKLMPDGLCHNVPDARRLIDLVYRIETRCMAVDGPVSPTLDEARDEERRELARLCGSEALSEESLRRAHKRAVEVVGPRP